MEKKKSAGHNGSRPIVLSISGSDPSGGAGIEADLKTFHQHGVYGTVIPTLLTAQNTLGVKKVRFMDPDFLAEQWKALFADLKPGALKIGALGSRRMVLRIAKLLASPQARGIPIVLDPVMGSTSGASLLESAAIPVLMKRVFPLCQIITPNAIEFSMLCGKSIDAKNAENLLRDFGRDKSYAILLKGGHLEGADSTDLLWDRGRLTRIRGPRFKVGAHGTGCVLASSLAANLALGYSLPEACRLSKTFVRKALSTATRTGHGSRALNLWA